MPFFAVDSAVKPQNDTLWKGLQCELFRYGLPTGKLWVKFSPEGRGIRPQGNELTEKHPDKKAMFEGYVRSQQSEYDDIDNSLEGVVWVLKKL